VREEGAAACGVDGHAASAGIAVGTVHEDGDLEKEKSTGTEGKFERLKWPGSVSECAWL
jgi:hypothetical protein